MARAITNIVIHTTATPQNTTIESIKRYWTHNLKWRSPGYHKIIQADGSIVTLASDEQVTNGVGGYNSNSLHVSYIGGVDGKGGAVDNRTEAQKKALASVVAGWKVKYPNAIVLGHRDFPGVRKACPCFDAREWWASVGGAATKVYKLTSPFMEGPEVREIQRALGITVDGVFGPKTAQAVKNYQRIHRMKIDGIVGAKTLQALNLT